METKNLIRDLDLTLQPRIAPRYKVWLPLATQQLRLRNLIRIIGCNLRGHGKSETRWFYYTIHRTSMSSPLYSSELLDNASPRWASLEVPTLYATGHSTASEIVLRLWQRSKSKDAASDVNLFTWGVSLTGLVYLGPKLVQNLENLLSENTLVFQLHGGYFAPSFCFREPPELKKFLKMSIGNAEVKNTYTVNKLSSLRSKMQALKQQTDSVQHLRERIASGNDVLVPKYPQSMLNRLLQPKRMSKERREEIAKLKKELEVAKFRTKLLEQERVRKMGEVRGLNQRHSEVVEQNQDHGSELMDRYRELNKDIDRLSEWRQSHLDKRETYVQLAGLLVRRQKQLISELGLIYPVKQGSDGKFRINDVHLPDSESLETENDVHIAVALGFVAHTAQMIANFLNVPLRYKIVHYGSRSKIVDHINESIPDGNRQFPLYVKGKDKLQFHYAIYLLNKNIAQLRWYGGLLTADLKATLSNLATLMTSKSNQPLDSSKRTFSGSSLDIEPKTPPMQKVLFENYHRTSRSTSQLKAAKILFSSSLDQGLDKPMQPLNASERTKRICKSEESAIDEPVHICSSSETLNAAVFEGLQKLSRMSMDAANDIEIMTPMSVSKPAASAETPEDLLNRHRSSNSVSSCEMALSASQIDESCEIRTSLEDVDKRSAKNRMASSICSEPEERTASSERVQVRRRCESESRNDRGDASLRKSWQKIEANDDFQASTEYIDSIRRSSENVFARTEALAKKNASFKVVRPRT